MLRSLFAAATLLACAAGPVDLPPPPPPPPSGIAVRLLFIGNSLTYTYDVPDLVARMTTLSGRETPQVTSMTEASFALEDHWTMGGALAALRTGQFDRVILQQGPSTLAESGVQLRQWSITWANEARQYGARPGLYVVWPPAGGNLDAGIANHEAAASAANAALYPVGEAWREVWRVDPAMPLYGPDQFHPSPHGAWLAALIITAMVHDRPVTEFANLFPGTISSAQEAKLRAAATTAIRLYGRR